MSEAKYISVIHAITDEIVTAFKLENDATWVGKEKDELIATANYCESGQKIKMIFIKRYEKQNGIVIAPFFRAAPNQIKLKTNISGESNKHKIAKQNIYDGIYSGDIKINNEVINKNKIDDIYIEYRTAKSGYVIPDILIKFKEEDKKYGFGIFIEIQLSEQHKDETLIRTYSRVIEGFSGIWLWKEDFNKDMKLIDINLEIKSHRQLLSELDKKTENNFINKINKYGNIVDEKLVDFRKEIWEYFDSVYKSFQFETKDFSKNEVNRIKIENKKLSELKKLAEELDNVFYETNAKNLTENINKKVNDGLIFLEESIKNKIDKLIKKSLDQSIDKINKMCPICGSPMKIGKSMGGYNWYCKDFPIKCNGFIKEVNFNEN